jgi:hypothetical protein
MLTTGTPVGPGLPVTCKAPATFAADTLRATYEAGVPFAEFLAGAERRKEQWTGNYARGEALDATLVARAVAVLGTWRLLVVSVDSCSDSVNTVPYIARLVEQLPNVEMRVIGSEVGRAVMEAHRTPDGRAATPTVVLLDDQWQDRGCFVERPPVLRGHMDSLPSDDRFAAKMAWYEQDAGRATVAEIVAMIEAAGRGESQCR